MNEIDTKVIGNIKFFGLDKLTEMLGLSKATLRAYIKNGTLKGRKIGVKWYVCEDSVTTYLNATSIENTINVSPSSGANGNRDLNASIIQSYVKKINQYQYSSDAHPPNKEPTNFTNMSFIEALSASIKIQDQSVECVQWESWIGPDGEFYYISPYFEVVTGYSTAECFKDPNLLANIVHPADRVEFLNGLTDAIKNNLPYKYEHRLITKDKEIKWIRHQNWRVFTKDGRFLGRQVMLTDITHLKISESASEVTDILLNSLCENLKLSVIIIDSNYTIKTIKGVALLDSYMLFGQSVDMGSNLLQLPSDGNKDKIFSFVVRALNGSLVNEELDCEYQGIQKKLRFSIYPIKPVQSVETRDNALVCMVINETQIIKFVVDLDLDRKFKIYDQLPIMLHLLDDQNNIFYVNNKWCSLTGFEKHEVVGKNIALHFNDVTSLTSDQKRHFFEDNIKFKGIPGYLARKDGSQIGVILEGYHETDKNGTVWTVCLLREVAAYNQHIID